MKKSAVVLLAMMMLLAGCGGGRRAEMRERLQALNALNRADTVLTATHRDEAQELADWFDRHGSANEQMLAHYLLGRCYADMHEAPMALHCYQEAISRADTTTADCDFAQLSRVYGQSATIFYQQGLYRNQLEYEDIASAYAWRGNDTLAALRCYAMKGAAYDQLQMKDSAILIYKNAVELLKLYKYNKVAAGFSGTLAKKLIDKGDFKKVEPLLKDYEHHSVFFDGSNNIVAGREIYYCIKGLYYLETHQLDSAEYYFRKELRTGKDFNNQSAGARGLALLYQHRNIHDSAAKYALYYSEMNDSAYAHLATQEVEQAKAMYDYTRNQELAQQEKSRADRQEAHFWMVSFVLLLVCVFAGLLCYSYYRLSKKKEKEAAEYRKLKKELAKALADMRRLESNDTTLLDSKRQEVEQLQQQVLQYKGRLQAISSSSRVHDLQEKERIIAAFRSIALGKATITRPDDKHWKLLEEAFKRQLPLTFSVLAMKNLLSVREQQVAMLTLLGFSNGEMGTLLNVSAQRISNIKKEANQKLFNSAEASTLQRNLATLEQNV